MKLRYSADQRTIGLMALHWVFLAMAFYFQPTGLMAFLLGAAIAWTTFVQLISGHNSMHSAVFNSGNINRLWQILLSLSVGYPISAFIPVHNLSHHMHLQTPKDVLRTTEVRHSNNIFNLLHYVVMAGTHIQLLNFNYMWAMRRKRQNWVMTVCIEAIVVMAFISACLIFDGSVFLRFVVVPYLIGHSFIYGLGFLQHDGTDEESEFNHSRNFLGPLFNWFIFDNGYHTIHHNRPGLHWSLGRSEHERLIALNIHPVLDQYSILTYAFRTFISPGKRIRYDDKVTSFKDPLTPPDLVIPLSEV